MYYGVAAEDLLKEKCLKNTFINNIQYKCYIAHWNQLINFHIIFSGRRYYLPSQITKRMRAKNKDLRVPFLADPYFSCYAHTHYGILLCYRIANLFNSTDQPYNKACDGCIHHMMRSANADCME